MSNLTNRSYTAGHFLFTIDGAEKGSSWLKSVDGGAVKAAVVQEDISRDVVTLRHVASLEIEPVAAEVAISAAKPVLQWIKDSLKGEYNRRNGSIVHADFKYRATMEQEFQDALIAEVGFPALDASTKEPAYLSLKIHPELLDLKKGDGNVLTVNFGDNKEKMWLPSMFRMTICNVGEGDPPAKPGAVSIDCTGVNKIESISLKQKITPMYVGMNRLPQLEPAGIEFPNITVTMSAAYAGDFIDWHKTFVLEGKNTPDQEKTGYIEFLDSAGKKTLFTIILDRIGINSLTFEKSEANAEAIKRMKAELYVDAMNIEFGEGFE